MSLSFAEWRSLTMLLIHPGIVVGLNDYIARRQE